MSLKHVRTSHQKKDLKLDLFGYKSRIVKWNCWRNWCYLIGFPYQLGRSFLIFPWLSVLELPETNSTQCKIALKNAKIANKLAVKSASWDSIFQNGIRWMTLHFSYLSTLLSENSWSSYQTMPNCLLQTITKTWISHFRTVRLLSMKSIPLAVKLSLLVTKYYVIYQ